MANLNQRFTMNPTDVQRKRNTFHYSPTHKTTFNAGKLVPIFARTYYPGDTLSMDLSAFVRASTPLHATMDDAFIDTYFFAVPRRLVQDHWVNFMGENTESRYVDPVEYNLPYLRAPEAGFPQGSILDHFGIPIKVPGIEVEASHVRAYCLIWNEWFRDQNLQDPVLVPKDDATVTANATGDILVDAARGLDLLPVNKFHDYFTSALIEPQKGDDVTIPMLGDAPVYGDYTANNGFGMGLINPTTGSPYKDGLLQSSSIASASYNSNLYAGNPSTGYSIESGGLYFINKEDSELGNYYTSGVYADLSSVVGASINDLRMAFATQQYLETLARGGSRYTEQIRAFFGVTSPDARLQRPEYLAGKRIRIGMQQVVQTSSTVDDVSPQGNVAGYSLTSDVSKMFTTSFTEHTIVIGVACVRTAQTYQYGIPVEFSRKDRFDFVSPPFYNVGNLPIYNREIFAQGNAQDDEVFGFKEAWAELRDMPNTVSGAFRSNADGTLDTWHYAEAYTTLPRLVDENWIKQSAAPFDRTLAVSSVVSDQFLADFRFDCTYISELTQYSIPGLTRL